jgi:hypothetical protein
MVPITQIPAQLRIGLTIVLLSAALVGCTSKDTPASTNGTWTITGKTTLIGAVNPLPGITVKCGGQSTTSGPDGSYELRGVPEGMQTITAEGPNCKPYSKSVEVRADTRHFIYLDFNGSTLSGYVSNMIDGPIQGATVTIGALSDLTDQGAHYQITDVPLKGDSIIIMHSRYYSARSFIFPAGPDTHVDFSLQRDTIVTGRIIADQYVDEAQPNSIFITTRLTLASNGYIGSNYYSNIRRHIYLNFDFPPFMKDSRVTMIDGSLELCTDGSYSALGYDVYALATQWFYFSLTYNQQPVAASSLPAVPPASVTGARYITVLTSAALQQLLQSYRTNGVIYGVTLQAQSTGTATSRSFYSMRSTVNQPRISFKVRF